VCTRVESRPRLAIFDYDDFVQQLRISAVIVWLTEMIHVLNVHGFITETIFTGVLG
jgi:hypothetical protein